MKRAMGVAIIVAACGWWIAKPGAARFSAAAEGLDRKSSADSTRSYLGFDANDYPGDAALPILRKSFSYAGYWLNAPPGTKSTGWLGKREAVRAQGFGFLVLFNGPDARKLKTVAQGKQKGTADGSAAAKIARMEGFPKNTVIFLDIEDGGRLSPAYHAYLRAWADELGKAGFRPGAYCSGMIVDEGGGVTIITADDIRKNESPREFVFWVYNDACPPAPGCVTPENPPSPSASGVSYTAVWQFAQSPRRKELTAKCAATYATNGNCYAAIDAAKAWHLDLNSATSPDPSSGR